MQKVKVTFANGAVRSAKGRTVDAALAKLKVYAKGTSIVSVAVNGVTA